jgi:polyferredoxin
VIPENLARSRRLFWLGRFLLALSAILLPVIAYGLAALLVDGAAQKEYFEAVSQILPVLLLALAIEQRYFTRGQSMPELPPELEFGEGEMRDLARWYTRAGRIYALMVLVILGLGEWVAVEVLATGQSSTADLKNTAGSLAAGFTALIVTALVGTKQISE